VEQLQSHIWLTASSYMGKYLRISSYIYIRKPFLIYDFATAPLWISLCMRKIGFSFLSVWEICWPWKWPWMAKTFFLLLQSILAYFLVLFGWLDLSFLIGPGPLQSWGEGGSGGSGGRLGWRLLRLWGGGGDYSG
jgi:hypothetical protein